MRHPTALYEHFAGAVRFSFDVTEGEDRYLVSMGRRDELSYSFEQLKANGVSLVLG